MTTVFGLLDGWYFTAFMFAVICSAVTPLCVICPGVVGGGVVVQPAVTVATISQGQIITGNMVYQMVNTAHGIVAQPVQVSRHMTMMVMMIDWW